MQKQPCNLLFLTRSNRPKILNNSICIKNGLVVSRKLHISTIQKYNVGDNEPRKNKRVNKVKSHQSYSIRTLHNTISKWNSASVTDNHLNNLKSTIFSSSLQKEEFFTNLITKQQNQKVLHNIVRTLYQNDEIILRNMNKCVNLQQFLTFLVQEDLKTSDDLLEFKPNPDSIEMCFILIVYSIFKWKVPSYNNENFNALIDKVNDDQHLELFVSKEVMNDNVFGKDLQALINNRSFQKSVHLLKLKLIEKKGWKMNYECRDDNVIIWINTLFESSTSKSIIQLNRAKHIPNIIIYDLLLRNPANELEYKFFIEIYTNYSNELNLLDQKKLHYYKINDLKFNRNLTLPPLFNNLFRYSLRSNIENLPKLIDIYLNDINYNIKSNEILEQLSEIIWQLSYDHTGEYLNKPSRYYQITQSKLIRSVNKMIENNKSLKINVTTMLGVSNLLYFKNFRKSFDMFKNAKKEFDHWQLVKFKPKDFENVLDNKAQDKINNQEILYHIKVDYNIKFLCNSILLLAVKDDNKEMIRKDLINIFNKVEPKILLKYPEIWDFVLIKLSYHNLLNEYIINNLLQEYLKFHKKYGINNFFVIDLIINKTTKFKLSKTMMNEKIPIDDNNRSHLISKLYRFANSEEDSKEALACARKLYQDTEFKSSKVNSSYLLGESIFSPEKTFDRYKSINESFKLTQISISSLFVSIFKLLDMGLYDYNRWDNEEPINFALREFNNKISNSYDDGKLYPNDNLLKIYIKVLSKFNKRDDLIKLLDKLVDLKYPLGLSLFNSYLELVPSNDKIELVNCLNNYDFRFKKLRSCKSEYELNNVKKRLPPIIANGSYKEFVEKLDINWDIVQRWNWPDRN